MKLLITSLVLLISLSACVTPQPTLYYWGEYEALLLQDHQEPGALTAGDKIERLNADIIKAQENGQNIPPGFYAHLGYLYFSIGDTNAGEQAFAREKDLFPESSHFIDGLLYRHRAAEESQ